MADENVVVRVVEWLPSGQRADRGCWAFAVFPRVAEAVELPSLIAGHLGNYVVLHVQHRPAAPALTPSVIVHVRYADDVFQDVTD